MIFYDKETGKVIPVIPEISDVVNYYHLGLKEGDVLPEEYFYIGRKNNNPGLRGLPETMFRNTNVVKKGNNKTERIANRIKAVEDFKKDFWKLLMTDKISKEQLLSLDGKKLVCFCGDNLCHGHVIKLFIDYVKKNELEFDAKKEEYQKKMKNEIIKNISKRKSFGI